MPFTAWLFRRKFLASTSVECSSFQTRLDWRNRLSLFLAAIRASKMPGIEGRHVSAAPGTAQRVSVMMSLYLFICVLSGCELFVPYFDWGDDDEKAKYFTYLRDAETQMFARQCAAGCCPRWPLDGG